MSFFIHTKLVVLQLTFIIDTALYDSCYCIIIFDSSLDHFLFTLRRQKLKYQCLLGLGYCLRVFFVGFVLLLHKTVDIFW